MPQFLSVAGSAGGKVLLLGPQLDRGALNGRLTVKELEIKEGPAVAEETGGLNLGYFISKLKEPLGTFEQISAKIRAESVANDWNVQIDCESSELIDHLFTHELSFID